ncbi:MAG: hypothetical protein IJ699_09765 [Bacteroidaceae bacterium]|nr:hypothetical protein [Bacteroidaceae bacterium]
MKIFVAPLNWGLGHAMRCVPLIRQWIAEGHQVVLGGDGESLQVLQQHFPDLPAIALPHLQLRYSSGRSQVLAILRSLPHLIAVSRAEHKALQRILEEQHFDLIVSDNRFGLYLSRHSRTRHPNTRCVYMTHQLTILLPRGGRWLQPLVRRLHARIYGHYDEVWIPDFAEATHSLAGIMSHPSSFRYLGPLSRFEVSTSYTVHPTPYTVVALLSGLEPHRTMLEQAIRERYRGQEEQLLIARGKYPSLSDDELASALLQAKHIIARSGYSTIMDLHALGLLRKWHEGRVTIELIPTPGQPEQEYLAQYIRQ